MNSDYIPPTARTGSLKYEATETQHLTSPLLAACSKAGFAESQVIELLFRENQRLMADVCKLLTMRTPSPIVLSQLRRVAPWPGHIAGTFLPVALSGSAPPCGPPVYVHVVRLPSWRRGRFSAQMLRLWRRDGVCRKGRSERFGMGRWTMSSDVDAYRARRRGRLLREARKRREAPEAGPAKDAFELRERLRAACENCPACDGSEADAPPDEALESWLRGEDTRPWWGGIEPAWHGHLDERWRTAEGR